MIAEVNALSEANVILVEDPRQLELSSYGIQGPRGNALLSGTTVPSPTLGIDNDLYLNLDTGFLYKKLIGTWTYQIYVTPQIKRFTLSPVEAASKQVLLSPVPNDPDTVTLEVLTGGGQENGVDFEVTGAVLSWAGLGLDGFLDPGDIIIVKY